MNAYQKFGGPWTVEKLNILSSYLDAYTTALKNQPFQLIYIDAFAGTGKIQIGDSDVYEEIDGSAKLALRSKGEFAEYIFIEKKKSFASQLEYMVHQDFSEKERIVKIRNEDCNDTLAEICSKVNWRKTRGLLFLDPYATDVRWETLKVVASTKAIDVWYLFPFSAVNRMMKKSGVTDPAWISKLNSIFGDNSWETEFYKNDDQINLWNDTTTKIRELDTDALKAYIEKQLSTIFPKVSSHSRILFNSKQSPLFLFCFAVSSDNPKAIHLALQMADHILKRQYLN